MAWQLGSLLPCLSQRDKSWLFIGPVCEHFTEWRKNTLTQTWGTGPNGVLNWLGPPPRHRQCLPRLLVSFRFEVFPRWQQWNLCLLLYKSNSSLNKLMRCWEWMSSLSCWWKEAVCLCLMCQNRTYCTFRLSVLIRWGYFGFDKWRFHVIFNQN